MTRNYKTTWTADQTVRAYIAASWTDDSATSHYKMSYYATALEQFLGRPALLRDLNDKTLSMVFEWLAKSKRKPDTIERLQQGLLRVGRHAAGRDIIPWPLPTCECRVAPTPTTDDPTRLLLVRYFEDVYLVDRGDSLSAETIKAYRDAIAAYERFSGRTVSLINKMNPRSIKRFRQWLIDRGITKKTAGNRAFAVAAIAKHAQPTRFLPTKKELREPTDGSRPLVEVFEKLYLPEKQKITQPGTQRLYIIAIESYGRFLGHIATLNDLTDSKVGAFMRALHKKGLANVTVNGYRSKLIALWTWCAKKRLAEDFPTIEEMPEPKKLPVAWSRDELRKLLKGCDAMPGHVGGIPSRLWWRALHLVAWDCGDRTGALLALRWDMLDSKSGQLVVPAEFRKGRRKPMLYALKRTTLRALAVISEPERELIFEFPFCLGTFYRRYRRLLKLAGLPYVKHKSGPQKMRRSFATHIEAAGGDGSEALAHTSRRLTVDSYIDPRMIERTPANELLFPLEATA